MPTVRISLYQYTKNVINHTYIQEIESLFNIGRQKFDQIIPFIGNYFQRPTDGSSRIKHHVFEKNDIAFVEITKPGWGFTFYKDNKLTPNFIVGSDASSIKEFFPFSLLKKGENFIRITIKTADNVGTESAVLFEIKAGKVKSVSFFTDES